MNRSDFVAIGKLGRTRGVHGEIFVTPMTDFPERFVNMKEIYVDNRGEWKSFNLESAKIISGRPVLKFAGVDSPEEAARLTNRRLAVPSDQLVKLPEDSYFIFDLVECEMVEESDGRRLGVVTDVRSYPANDVYVVRTEDGREVLFPAVKAFVRRVDLTEKKIFVQSGGLFEDQSESAET